MLHLNIKQMFIKTLVWSAITYMYGYETWVVNNAEKKKLDAFELKCWRCMESISQIEQKTNKKVLRTVKKIVHSWMRFEQGVGK